MFCSVAERVESDMVMMKDSMMSVVDLSVWSRSIKQCLINDLKFLTVYLLPYIIIKG